MLLLVLGAVAAVRLTGSSADDKLASATDGDNGKEKEKFGKEGKNDPLFKDLKPRHPGSGNQVTIVPAEREFTKPPKHPDSAADRWASVADKNSTRGGGGGGGSPTFGMPAPPIADPFRAPEGDRAKRRDRQESELTTIPDAREALRLQEASPGVNLIPPGEERHQHAGHVGAARTDPDGFVEVDLLPAAPPFAMEPPRRGPRSEPAMQMPSQTEPPNMAGAGFVPAGAPAAPYGAEDRRHELAELTRDRGGLHHRDGVASLSPPPARRDDGKYEVQPNDSFWTISEKLYGTGAYFKALAQQNRGKGASEDRLRPGDVISAPAVAELEKSYPDLCPKPSRREALQSQSRVSAVSTRQSYRTGRTYTVAEGDTLFNIARYELGKASRWAEIYELNRDVLGKDFNYLTPGTQLALPDSEKSDSLTRQPNNSYRR